ncbi:MAG: hypothetical protein M1820_003417 [Bogoriella megaspora]|nr:MAG: hypothetical protein M1820_003417 [Bogoriella megaspora]
MADASVQEASTALEQLNLDEAPAECQENMPRILSPRPQTPRRSTEPPVVFLSNERTVLGTLPLRHQRNRSPYSRSHLRSRSGNGSLAAPPMSRARSLPSVSGVASLSSLSPSFAPSSPLRSPVRVRSPARPPPEESYPPSTGLNPFDIDPISEDSELDLTPRANFLERERSSSALSSPLHATFPRASASARRRPTSPLHQLSPSPSGGTPTSTSFPSPQLAATRFNETYPTSAPPTFATSSYTSSSTGSSIPSTPTSTRSRSPSISSLETIPDSPDAEAAALLADAEDRARIMQLKAAADAADRKGAFRRGSFNIEVGGRWGGFGGLRDKRKRWSVCGAERRGDLDLETIWED